MTDIINKSYFILNIMFGVALRRNLKCFSYMKNQGKGADKN